ncbi:hypothetical protein [Desulfoscipio gibsoniae]|uniref:Uncharacterized protein n=1 Tax=Desulfoscipio gibsoniae DSM 7213 TaxID=767817 RepID=R4KH78_9FIRM|nr:hypothetical protein [Desulfoscipio gibsoniae]AGL02538.1 hypothetical protein Desgi_3183 [Desulfoscipio gibsoniae DSM 7213]
MNVFKSKRTVKKYIQKLNASPNKLFPLLCPTMEYKWIQPWKCEMIFSQSGYAEDNCVFRTDFPRDIEPETWIVSQYEKDKTIQFIRFNSSIIIRHNIILIDNGNGTTDAIVEQIITGLNEKGNKYVEGYTDEAYFEEISTLEKMLNYYLEKGEMLKIME